MLCHLLMNWIGYGVLNAHGAMCNENWPNSYARDLLHLRIPNLPHFSMSADHRRWVISWWFC